MSWRMGSSWSLVIVALALFPALACEDDDDDGGGLSSDADLADLFVSAGFLTPDFDPSTTGYTVMTTSSTSSTTITPFSSDANATLEINGQAATSGADFGPALLIEGMNSFDIVVTAEDGITTRTYTVGVTRPPPTLPVELAASPAAPLQVRGAWLVYLASEAFNGPGGTDLNGDGDTIDAVAAAVNMDSTVEETLGVATTSAAILGDEVYLTVDEDEDGKDWNGDADTDDDVLLHWSESSGVVSFVDELSPSTSDPELLVVETRLYYRTEFSFFAVDETSLRYLEQATPTVPVVVLNEIGGGALDVRLMTEDQGLVFLTLHETEHFRDLNGDGDLVDENVLVLLDGTDPAARVKNVRLALQDESSPVDARSIGPHDWLVAFLVDEADQGSVSLNDQNAFSEPLLPPVCAANPPDLDAIDEVLHFLDVSDFLAGNATPINTGLAGRERVLALAGFVATIGDETDAGCDLNSDGDANDGVARWVATVTPVAPAREAAQMHALATSIAGGSRGLAHIDERLIAVVSEANDEQELDLKPADHDLVGWLDPSLGTAATWNFAHQHPTLTNFGTGVFDTDGDSEPFAGSDWMAAEPIGDRLGISFLEEVPGTNTDVGSLNTNLDCTLVMKDSDKTDALPVWADFETGPTLDWDGLGYAVDRTRAGIVLASGNAFFRVSEGDDNQDHNADGDLGDIVVFRNPLTVCAPQFMATGSSLPADAIETDGVLGAAFLSSESMAGTDLNEDGDTTDVVARYFRF